MVGSGTVVASPAARATSKASQKSTAVASDTLW
jgi:hypothetical protein